MRPLSKGSVPTDLAGNPLSLTDYKIWRKHLIARIGCYCAYCNQPLSHNLQVEHVIPQNPPAGYTPGDPIAWNNMLLACGPCNTIKDNKPVDSDTYYLPEEHNTHLPFSMKFHTNTEHAIVTERQGLSVQQQQKAQRTISMLGLDNIDERPKIVDIRSIRRKAAILSVQSAKWLYDTSKASPTYQPDMVAECIVRWAEVCGFFSLWYEAFASEPLVMEKLTDNSIIKGTATNCFDAGNGYTPIPRNPAHLTDSF